MNLWSSLWNRLSRYQRKSEYLFERLKDPSADAQRETYRTLAWQEYVIYYPALCIFNIVSYILWFMSEMGEHLSLTRQWCIYEGFYVHYILVYLAGRTI